MAKDPTENKLSRDFEALIHPMRSELLAHAYRMTGAMSDAEDCLQDSMLRAWRAFPTLQDQGKARAWMYRIVTNVCLSASVSQGRSLPWAIGPAQSPLDPMPPPLPPETWVDPFGVQSVDTPQASLLRGEELGLAFVHLLQHLTPAQRSAYILREVAGLTARETAEALDLKISAVESALTRARKELVAARPAAPTKSPAWSRVSDYIKATETGDLDLLASLLADDARLCMPPLPVWFDGKQGVLGFLENHQGEAMRRLDFRMLPTQWLGDPAIGLYQRQSAGAVYQGIGVQLLGTRGDQVTEICCFLGPQGFAATGLPASLS